MESAGPPGQHSADRSYPAAAQLHCPYRPQIGIKDAARLPGPCAIPSGPESLEDRRASTRTTVLRASSGPDRRDHSSSERRLRVRRYLSCPSQLVTAMAVTGQSVMPPLRRLR